MVHNADPDPFAPHIGIEPLGKPAQLTLADPAVVILVAVTLAHRRVQPGDNEVELFDLPQGPGLLDGESDAGHVAVEGAEHPQVGLPLARVGLGRLALLGFALLEVGLAELAVDVVVAGDHDDVAARHARAPRQAFEELQRVVELFAQPPLGEVA